MHIILTSIILSQLIHIAKQNEALSMGYRLFDCAPVYFNEKEIGDAFHEATSSIPRTDVFITSKLAGPFHRPEHVEVRYHIMLANWVMT